MKYSPRPAGSLAPTALVDLFMSRLKLSPRPRAARPKASATGRDPANHPPAPELIDPFTRS
jgi:hypothetical protein